MTDRRRMKLTQEQVFERWWAKCGARPYPGCPLDDHMLSDMKAYARMSFYRGYALGRKRQRERQ